MAFRDDDLSLSYLLEFIAKTEYEKNPILCSFLVRSLSEFIGDLPEERLLCPVHAVRIYLDLTSSISPHPWLLIVSPRVSLAFFVEEHLVFLPVSGYFGR